MKKLQQQKTKAISGGAIEARYSLVVSGNSCHKDDYFEVNFYADRVEKFDGTVIFQGHEGEFTLDEMTFYVIADQKTGDNTYNLSEIIE